KKKPGYIFKNTYVSIHCGPSVIHHAQIHCLFLLLNTSCSLLNALLGRPCVDCHAFEFMQRALQDLKKTAYNLDTRTETLLLQVEKRNLCDCVTANLLN
uniref:NELL2-interacting cell ontogeny regulator 1 n=1 Tax=Phasianus colchicus TaxID=9054 RepID=A0A669P6A7_PHACC